MVSSLPSPLKLSALAYSLPGGGRSLPCYLNLSHLPTGGRVKKKPGEEREYSNLRGTGLNSSRVTLCGIFSLNLFPVSANKTNENKQPIRTFARMRGLLQIKDRGRCEGHNEQFRDSSSPSTRFSS